MALSMLQTWLFSNLESGTPLGHEISLFVAEFGFCKGDGATAVTNKAFANKSAAVGSPDKTGFELECDLWCTGNLMGEAYGVATKTIKHGGEKATENTPSSIDEIFARVE